FPTANMDLAPHTAVPEDGVYAGWLHRVEPGPGEESWWPAAISVGTNPTFDGAERTVEAYARDRDDLDRCGVRMSVDFRERARGGGGVVVARCDLGGYQPHVRRC